MSSAQAAATAAFKGNRSSSDKKASAGPNLRPSHDAAKPPSHSVRASGTSASQQVQAAKPLPRASTGENRPEEHTAPHGVTGDYFSYKKSGAKDIPKAENARKRLSTNTRPQDMLDSVRHSIMSKSKSNTSKESHAKNQLAINEFRHSVDLKRVTTPTIGDSSNHSILSPILLGDRGRQSSSSLISNSSNNTSEHGYASHSNLSHSSLGSAMSENEISDSSVPNLTITLQNSSSDEPTRISGSRIVTPITIPPSPNARARELALLNENMPHLSLSHPASSSDAVDSSTSSVKPGRKPPPQNIDSPTIHSSIRRESSESDRNRLNASDTDDSNGASFPLFPDLSMKHHSRRTIFKKKKKKVDSKGVVYDPSSNNDDAESDLIPNSSHHPVSTHPVKLKTTMRKMSKRKERKTLFNEDKPWKYQKDLEVISESQRKRYEGLWVSNKGLYMDHVFTKLVGVDYSGQATSKETVESRLSEKDIIERAAKLSSKALTEIDHPDLAALHGLKEATPSDLIHGAVVKRLWSRSKLPSETLEAIWNLVDFRHDGTLNKSEFIVGMWCVDQCLYGRKLPKVVSKSVWSSLGSLGVNVTIKKKRR